ncbi:MAG: hypothetical protein RRY95_04215 [Oscillospiraceae bacterium]
MTELPKIGGKPKFSVPFYGCDFFSKDLLSIRVRAVHRTVSQETPLLQCDGMTGLLVVQGSGWATVNGVSYRLSPGRFLMLGMFQYYAIRADAGSELELYESYLNGDACLYIMACPYYHLTRFDLPRAPTCLDFTEEEERGIRRLMQQMVDSCIPGTFQRSQVSFTLALKLFGMVYAKRASMESAMDDGGESPSLS